MRRPPRPNKIEKQSSKTLESNFSKEQGYLEKELSKPCLNIENELSMEADVHMSRLLNCKNDEDIYFEMSRHLTKEYAIKLKHLKHNERVAKQGIQLTNTISMR